MAAMSDGVTLDAKMEGGFLKSLGRSALGGNSFFVTSYTSSVEGGWVDVAAVLRALQLALELVHVLHVAHEVHGLREVELFVAARLDHTAVCEREAVHGAGEIRRS